MNWNARVLALVALLVVFSLPDLLSPPITPTISRQTQTYTQTLRFVEAGFSVHGLTIDIDGPKPFHVVYEFPVFQALAGLFFKLFFPAYFWGKLVSLVSLAVGFWVALRLACRQWGPAITWRAGLFFAVSPITLLVSASFQPDALALGVSVMAAGCLCAWRERPTILRWALFLVVLLVAALTKFTVLVPFLPLLVWAVFYQNGRWRMLRVQEWLLAVFIFLVPFVAWNLHRSTLMDPRYLVGERDVFLIGDLTRFFRAGFYVKPAFILGAMVLCGAGVPLALLGLRALDRTTRLLAIGIPVYFILIPTVADQTYYALPLVPVLALLAARGALSLEQHFARHVRLTRMLIVSFYLAGFAIAAPYTLRHDQVSLRAAEQMNQIGSDEDLLLVLNCHDRGVGIGGFNPTLFTLAGRRGWNLRLDSVEGRELLQQITTHRAAGARWLLITWFTPNLDPWFSRLLPASFSRCPRIGGTPVDGQRLATALAGRYPVVNHGLNHLILKLP
jgi:hypothetical protein